MSVIARLIGGRVVGKVPIVGLISVLAAAQGASLVLIAFSTSTAALFPSIILFGATVGNLLMLQPLLVAERFGIRDYARIYSRSSFFTMVGTAGGPLLLGWLYDNVAGGFRTTYLVAGLCSASGALVLALGGPAVMPAGEARAIEERARPVSDAAS
jgi:MFS family permease